MLLKSEKNLGCHSPGDHITNRSSKRSRADENVLYTWALHGAFRNLGSVHQNFCNDPAQ